MLAKELYQRTQSNSTPVVVDVRSEDEFRRGHIPGAINASVGGILLNRTQLPADRSRELVITCERGGRARMAQLLLGFYGYRNTSLLEGHMEEWTKAGLPLYP